jgi:hypothetical protein
MHTLTRLLAGLVLVSVLPCSATLPQIKTSDRNILLVVPEGANVSIAYVDAQNNQGTPTRIATQRDIEGLLAIIGTLNQSLIAAVQALDANFKLQTSAEASRTSSSITLLNQSSASSLSSAVRTVSSTLQGSINLETSRATFAENSLRGEIVSFLSTVAGVNSSSSPSAVSESLRAQSAEFSLALSISALSDALIAEKNRAIGAEGLLATTALGAVNTETNRAVGVENALSTSITTLQSTTRSSDNLLNISILSEVSAGAAETSRGLTIESSLALATSAARAVLAAADLSLATSLTFTQASQALSASNAIALAASQAALASSILSVNTTTLAFSAALANTATYAALNSVASTLSTAVATEVSRATRTEASLSAQITLETSRAISTEASLALVVAANGAGAPYWITPHGALHALLVLCLKLGFEGDPHTRT